MKTKITIKSLTAVFSIALLISTSVFAQSTTWDGTGLWTNPVSWNNGIPNATTDAVVAKVNTGNQSFNIPHGSTFQNLMASNNLTNDLSIYIGDISIPVHGTSANFFSSGSGTIRMVVNNLVLSDSLLFVSESTLANAANLYMNPGSTLSVTNGIVLGGNNTTNANVALTHAGIGNTNTVINADVTFNKGSRYWAQADSKNGTLAINGSVTLQAGAYAGPNAGFDVGRASTNDNGFIVKVRDQFAATSASVSVWKGKTLEVGSATFSSNSTLVLKGYAGLTGDATFRSHGDFILDGGYLNNNNAAGDSGALLLDVGGNFILRTGSSVALHSGVLGVTTLQLAQDFDIQATSLSGGNLNQLRLTLIGGASQTLEAAVTGGNATFSIHTLSLSNSYVSLVNAYTNIASGEYFKTTNLFNSGVSTLDLNGLKFYIGSTELTSGTYNTYGGTLNVIPEPTTMLLLVSALGGLLMYCKRRRQISRDTLIIKN